jgi:hypothetical protein
MLFNFFHFTAENTYFVQTWRPLWLKILFFNIIYCTNIRYDCMKDYREYKDRRHFCRSLDGKLSRIDDHSGLQYFEYGNMGEVTKQTHIFTMSNIMDYTYGVNGSLRQRHIHQNAIGQPYKHLPIHSTDTANKMFKSDRRRSYNY